MGKDKKKFIEDLKLVQCPKCGYQNRQDSYYLYGTCTGCGYVLNEQNKFRHDMYNKLKLWRKDKKDETKSNKNR